MLLIARGSRASAREESAPLRDVEQQHYRIYSCEMAKVMISLPDDLLEQIDTTAVKRGTTRSGLLRDLAKRELDEAESPRSDRVDALLKGARGHGGDATAAVRELRRSA